MVHDVHDHSSNQATDQQAVDPMLGYCAALIAIVCFGSNFVFAKGIQLGDGVFFQFVMCVSIWMTSLPLLFYWGHFPSTTTDFGIAMMGGGLWCTGNMLAGSIIQLIGLGMGLLIWGTFNMLMGWASGCFGLFGLDEEYITNPSLNYAGVSLAVLGLVLYLQVRPGENDDGDVTSENRGYSTTYQSIPTEDSSKDMKRTKSYQSITRSSSQAILMNLAAPGQLSETSNTDEHRSNNSDVGISVDTFTDDNASNEVITTTVPLNFNDEQKSPAIEDMDPYSALNTSERRIFGFVLAVLAGSLFGCSFNPAQWVIENKYHGEGYAGNTLTYVFPHYTGIVFCSWIYTVLYCFIMQFYFKKSPYVSSDIFIPAVLSGILWGIAAIAWFIANQNLGFAISFPLITSGPGFIGALWGVFRFKEIQGRQNFTMLSLAFLVTIPALIMVGWSH